MRAALSTSPADGLSFTNTTVPRPGPGEALILVHCVGVAETDLVQCRSGHELPSGVSPIVGTEFSGVIVDFGEPDDKWKIGDAVFGIIPGGAYAEYVVAPLDMLVAKPEKLNFEEAASLLEVWFRAIQALVVDAEFAKMDKLIIRDAATPSGLVTVQLAQILGCRRVFAMVRGSTSAPTTMKLLGALPDEVAPYMENERGIIAEFGDMGNIQAIVDFSPSPVFDTAALSLGGRIVAATLNPLSKAATLDPVNLVYKRVTLKGSPGVRTLSPPQLKRHKAWFEEHILPRYLNGKLSTRIGARFHFDDIAAAHAWAEANPEGGKVVVALI